MAVVTMIVGSITALFATLFLHLLMGLDLGQAVTVYFGTGLMTMLLAFTVARFSFAPAKATSLVK